MRPMMTGVGHPELAQGIQQVALVPDQRAVQQFAPTGLDPALRDRVHSGYPDTSRDDPDPGIGQHFEGRDELRVAAADEESDGAARLLQVRDEVPAEPDNPLPRGMRGDLEDLTRRVACWMMAETYSRAPVKVRTSKKSHASRASAWLRRKPARAVCWRSGDGSMP
ncbi:hypothetical protein [Streptosporangium canum]|uniref:hypothetical protein n=1 Tax=Streptosporangium canum TaxID=324952 RepID=UPI001C432BEC|nr:hypothetical protein [Streptosporangium canum]